MFDYVIIGAGFSGSVLAERIANILNKNVLIIDKRDHIGGNCYDYYDNNGVLIHKYGPHIFHTKIKKVWDYLSNFTEWNLYHHKVLGVIDGNRVPIPFNLNSLHKLLPQSKAEILEKKLVEEFGYNVKIPILKLREKNDTDLKFIADFVYEKIFLNYTMKQWGVKPDEIDPLVTNRVPVYISKDDRYFQDTYQGMPKYGYTTLFNNLLNNKNIKIMLNTDYKEIIDIDFENKKIFLFGQEFEGKFIFSGMIDELLNYQFGEMPYRSLNFHFENIQKEYFQETGTVNYPNDYDFTRITEFKHLSGQKTDTTTIVREYPQNYERNVDGKNIPYYPIANDNNFDLYNKYKNKIKNFENIYLLGRLADYKYYDMDMTINRALEIFDSIKSF
ncbi:MAG TPA: UDP-galactopyranose mutase [Spirochaetota bacterium]|nr:UDP-galactopyranose mutase [Spirochaetota bacterium]